jgi:hypothetical protein
VEVKEGSKERGGWTNKREGSSEKGNWGKGGASPGSEIEGERHYGQIYKEYCIKISPF